MAKNILDSAKKYLKRREFSKVITLLEPHVIEYRDSFQFFYYLGISCLYIGDVQGAETYFRKARQIKINNVNLILAQAVLFLKRGAIDRALEYCLDALELEPDNSDAKKFLVLINKYGDQDTISEWNHNGKIKVFYPSLPKKSPVLPIFCVCAFILILGSLLFFITKKNVPVQQRSDLSSFVLSVNERNNLIDVNDSTSVYKYILTQTEVSTLYEQAQRYYNEFNDNECQKCINKILNSNASPSIRQKARLLMDYLQEPVFDTKLESYTYKQISTDLYLYQDCWVIWSGRVTNVETTEIETLCDFLVGYEDMQKIDGIAPLKIPSSIILRNDKPLKVLAKITIFDGKLMLQGKSVYQPLSGDNL